MVQVRVRRWSRRLAGTTVLSEARRARLLRWGGLVVGEDTRIEHGVVAPTEGVTIGVDCYINVGCVMDAGSATIDIGDQVNIGAYVVLAASSHHTGDRARRAAGIADAPIRIGSGSWIGAGVVVLPGVTIGPGCIIGAGAVVTGDCPPDGVYAGVPARRVRELG